MTTEIFTQLSRPFESSQLKQRPISKNSSQTVQYLDAKTIMDRLDDVLGPERWSDDYIDLDNGAVRCILSIQTDDGPWISKSDVGEPTSSHPVKGAYSDAFKRAAVKWGIGRYLNTGQRPSRQSSTSIDWRRFWPYTKDQLGLTPNEVYAVLQVESVKDYKGSKADAFALLKQYASNKGNTVSEQETLPF